MRADSARHCAQTTCLLLFLREFATSDRELWGRQVPTGSERLHEEEDQGDQQRRDEGCFKGSWDPLDAWGEEGGRVYSTSLLTMCLEVYYRYGRVFGTK